jgi:hypothetical protein
MITASISLLQSNQEINRIIMDNIVDYLTPRIRQAARNIQTNIAPLVAQGLRDEPEYQSLIAGELKAEFGLPSADIVDSVINSLSNSIEINEQPLSTNRAGIRGGFTLTMIKSDDLSGVINYFSANITTTKGDVLPWLQWLTLSGNTILIRDYSVSIGSYPKSRSGMAVMKPETGGSWRVPPQFVGTIDNNWITRAISRIENNIYDLMIKSIENQI